MPGKKTAQANGRSFVKVPSSPPGVLVQETAYSRFETPGRRHQSTEQTRIAMQEQYAATLEWLERYPELHTLISLGLLLLSAWLGNWLVKRILVHALCRLVDAGRGPGSDNQLIKRLANIVPTL